MTRKVVYSRRTQQQLSDLYEWIADQTGFPDRAESFVSSILRRCAELADSPHIGTARDDIRPGLRTMGFRRRVVIAFAVTDKTIEVVGVYYGGRDYERQLHNNASPPRR